MGWAVVSSGDLRRRHAPRFLGQPGGEDRFAAAILGVPERRRRAESRGSGPGIGVAASRSRGRGTGAALRAALRQDGAVTGIHQGVPSRGAGERRPVHPRRRVVRDGHWRAKGTARGRPRSCACSTPSSTHGIRRRSGATGSSPTWSRPTSTGCRGGSARAAGPGTRARRRGCTGPGSKRSWGSRCAGSHSRLDPVIPGWWDGFSIRYRHGEAVYEIQVENPSIASGACRGWSWMVGVFPMG